MNTPQEAQEAWYTTLGPESDVILSSRVRLARNLSGFAFPDYLKSDDAERVLSLVFDAFNHCEEAASYQMVRISGIDVMGRKILAERGIMEAIQGVEPWRGMVIKNDGILSALVNVEDHLRIACFAPGFDIPRCATLAHSLDSSIQKRMQFSAREDFGYVTANVLNSGTGMKVSVLASLPALCMSGMIDRVIRDFLASGFTITGTYPAEGSLSAGSLYQLSNTSACEGSVETQIRALEESGSKLIDLERKSRTELLASRSTRVEDTVFRAIVTAKYARFIAYAEAVDLIQRIRLGFALGLITGTTHADLTALLYRVQNAHIGFVILSGSIIIEEDIDSEELRLDRLRAMVIQEVLKKADIRERR